MNLLIKTVSQNELVSTLPLYYFSREWRLNIIRRTLERSLVHIFKLYVTYLYFIIVFPIHFTPVYRDTYFRIG